MVQIILAVNAGSSSVKISVYKANLPSASPSVSSTSPSTSCIPDPEKLAEAQISGLTAPPQKFSCVVTSSTKPAIKNQEISPSISSQDAAFNYLLDKLISDPELPSISGLSFINLTVHRIVHGSNSPYPLPLTPSTLDQLTVLSDLAPLHNTPALTIIHSCLSTLPPTTKHIACFDTSFHTSIPPHIYTYPISPTIAARNNLRKYGFHGLSYAFILRSVATFLNRPSNELSLIALHLGSGASACAIRSGRSLDTSMGLTPLAGLPGATRSGDIDPSLVFHFTSHASKLSPSSTKEMHISTAEEILNKESGWKALTGTTDFQTITSRALQLHNPDQQCKLAFDIFVDRILGFVGSYFVKLEGKVDAIVFAGGIGEKSEEVRLAVMQGVQCLGFRLDEEKNAKAGDTSGVVLDIGVEDNDGESRKRTLVCRTDEQFEMAREVIRDRRLWGEHAKG